MTLTPFGKKLRFTPCFPRTLLLSTSAIALAGPLWAAEPIDESRLEEVIVTSSRVPMSLREVGTSVSVMTESAIRERGFLNLPDILRTQPSVTATANGGAGKASSVRIRGEEGFRTLVLLDGMDLSDPSSPQVSPRLEHLMSSGIDRIEILRGPQGLSYGADAGGIINMRTVRPQSGFGGSVTAEGGEFGTRNLSANLGTRGERGDVSLIASQFETDGFNARDTDTDIMDDDGYENTTVHLRGAWDASDSLRLEAVYRDVSGENEFDGCFNAAFTPTNNCADDFDQQAWRVAGALTTGNFTHTLSYSDTQTDRVFFADGGEFFAAEGGLERVSFTGNWTGSERLRLVYGVDRETESIDDGSFDRDRDQTGVFVEYQGRFADALTITAGVRNDDNDDFGDYTSQRISAAWTRPLKSGELKLKGTLGTGFRAPSLYEISYNSGPFAFPPASLETLREETSAGYDLGIAWANNDGTYLELTWFDQEIEDLIDFDLVGFSGYLQSDGTTDSRGVEAVAIVALPLGLQLDGNYTWNDTETPAGIQRALRPEHSANLTLSHSTDSGRFNTAIILRGASNSVDTAGNDLDDYLLLALNLRYGLASGLTVYGRLENAFDDDYREVPTFFTAGRAAYAGVRYEF